MKTAWAYAWAGMCMIACNCAYTYKGHNPWHTVYLRKHISIHKNRQDYRCGVHIREFVLYLYRIWTFTVSGVFPIEIDTLESVVLKEGDDAFDEGLSLLRIGSHLWVPAGTRVPTTYRVCHGFRLRPYSQTIFLRKI